MHTEFVAVRRHTIERLLAHEGHAIAVGTTSVRTLESLYYMGLKILRNPDIKEEELHVNQWEPYEVEAHVTNFHQPQSTLLLLVSAFVKGDWHKIYDYALAHDFRFLSYGDSSLLIP